MKCVLLCAGYATRLFPLTKNFPKALIEVGGKAIIDYILKEVNEVEEIDEIYVVTNNKYYNHFSDWAKSKNNIKPIRVFNDGTLTNDDRLGAIGDIVYTIDNAKIDDDMMIIATDNLFEFKLKYVVEFYKSKNTPCICAREENEELLKRLGVAELDENGKVLSFEEKPSKPKGKYGVYATYVYPKSVIPMFKKYIEEGYSNDAPGNFVGYLQSITDVYAYPFEGEYYDVGTHETLEEVRKLYQNK